jgi:solute carrier family 25 protein 39/40
MLEHGAAAVVGSTITALLMNPLDVVKTRQQTAAAAAAAGATAGGGGAARVAALATLRRVVAAEGAGALWGGLSPTLMVAIPGSILFFVAYEEVRRAVAPATAPLREWGAAAAACVAGATARTATVLLASPLELLRTQAQNAPARLGVARGLAAIARSPAGLGGLWRGASATLARDIPFSAVYWSAYEVARRAIDGAVADHDGGGRGGGGGGVRVFMSAFAAGASAGTLAAFMTTPMDVVKTRRQVGVTASGRDGGGYTLGRELGAIARAEGVAGLFRGLAPRLVKVAPSCAVMIGSYECVKRALHAPPYA